MGRGKLARICFFQHVYVAISPICIGHLFQIDSDRCGQIYPVVHTLPLDVDKNFF